MLGAKEFNAARGQPPRPVYGCVTSGELWQFLVLDSNGTDVTIAQRRYFLAELPAILGALLAAADDALGASPQPAE